VLLHHHLLGREKAVVNYTLMSGFWVKFYKYCFGLTVTESVLEEYDKFIAGRENVLFQLFIILFFVLFSITDVIIAVRDYDRAIRVHQQAGWVRLGLFSSIAAALWMSCVAVVISLKHFKSKSKLFQKLSPYYRSILECGIIVSSINLCLIMVTRVHVGICETNNQAYCNDNYQCGMLPQPLLLSIWFMSAGIRVCYRGVSLGTILFNLFIGIVTYIYCTIVVGPVTVNTIKVIALYSVFGFLTILEFQRSSVDEFMLNRKLNGILVENRRLEHESRSSEMRIMVFNLAHNFKKVQKLFPLY